MSRNEPFSAKQTKSYANYSYYVLIKITLILLIIIIIIIAYVIIYLKAEYHKYLE